MHLGISAFDHMISRAARRHPAGKTARFMAKLCSPWAATAQGIAAAAVLRATGRPSFGVAIAPLAAVAGGKLLKRATHRPRPGFKRWQRNGHRSFPSSHVAGPAALLTAVWFHSPTRARVTVAFALGAVVAAIGLERLRAAAHWPSDIAAGTALGILVGGTLGRA
jgi:membrane-associated phospholipid phosphatase